MLNVSITPHREFLPAETPDQRLDLLQKFFGSSELTM